MGRFSRLQVYEAMHSTRVVPVFYNADVDLCFEVAQACYQGGARIFEFTNRGDFAHEHFRALEKRCAIELPGMILGVGSIIEPGTASLYMQLGANFIVAPILNEDVAKVCNRRKVAWMPGCGSASEISKAEELGAEIVKIFPGAQVGGAEFIKAVRGPMPWVSIMPTGGITPTEEGLKKWFSSGACCLGLGSQLVSKSILERKAFDELEEATRVVVEAGKKYGL